VHFRLEHDGRRIADYVSCSDAKNRVQQVLGRDEAGGLVTLRGGTGSIRIRGYASAAPASFPNARHLYTFVNRRYVRDKVLSHAVLFGYETLLMKGQYPAVVLFLELPFEDVDVNVHPAKYEVRFRRQGDVHQAVSQVIREALQVQAKAPSSAAGDFRIPRSSEVREFHLSYAPSPAALPRAEVFSPSESVAAAAPTENGTAGYFSSLQVLGQIFGCYIVCVSSSGLVLIDQHAAHERVAFEWLRHQLDAGRVETQSLLIPQVVELSAGEMMLLENRLDWLARLGFVLEPFGPSAYAIQAVPALLAEGEYTQLLRQMIAELADVDTSAKLRQHLEDRLATMACHSVIRAHRKLEPQEMRALLEALDETDFATQCPHGRPVLIEWSRTELDRIFRRIV
jgi:DNA mismatch repair protein MutL